LALAVQHWVSKALYLEVKPNGVKAWHYRFKLAREGVVKESVFAIGEYASAPNGETAEEAPWSKNEA
jgi:hypothetical protein